MIEPSRNRLMGILALAVAVVIPGLLPQAARGMYDPKHGRWLQRDPADYVDGMNLYQYGRSTPVVVVDPMGGCTEPEPPPCQCCCVQRVWDPILTKTVNDKFGLQSKVTQEHVFEVNAELTYISLPLDKQVGTKRNCIFQWWEWMDQLAPEPKPAIRRNPTPTGVWVDQRVNNKNMMGMWDDLKRHIRERDSGPSNPFLWRGYDTVKVVDQPGIQLGTPPFKRDLYIGIRVADAPNCPCMKIIPGKTRSSYEARVHQKLDSQGEPTLHIYGVDEHFPSKPGEPPW